MQFAYTLTFVGMIMLSNYGNYMVQARITGNILTNEVVETVEEAPKDLPYCRTGSACGYLQVNAFGVYPTQFCRCPSRTSVCPLHWDDEDGKSITMGAQQFKYCGPAPSLRICNRAEPAYTSAFLFDQSTFDVMGVVHSLHCMCPPPRHHVQHGNTEDIMNNMLVLGSVQKCSMLPECAIDDFCKEISLVKSSGMVTSKCRCPRGTICPTLSTQAVPNEMNENFFHGKAFSVRCQPWF